MVFSSSLNAPPNNADKYDFFLNSYRSHQRKYSIYWFESITLVPQCIYEHSSKLYEKKIIVYVCCVDFFFGFSIYVIVVVAVAFIPFRIRIVSPRLYLEFVLMCLQVSFDFNQSNYTLNKSVTLIKYFTGVVQIVHRLLRPSSSLYLVVNVWNTRAIHIYLTILLANFPFRYFFPHLLFHYLPQSIPMNKIRDERKHGHNCLSLSMWTIANATTIFN